MKHEKIFKREDGSRAKITVNLFCDYKPFWDFTVSLCGPRKKSWEPVVDSDSYTFRRLTAQEKTAKTISLCLLHVSQDEVFETMQELWTMLCPPRQVAPNKQE